MALFTFQEIRDICGGTFSRTAQLNATVDEVVTDTRVKAKNGLFIALAGERFDAHDFLAEAALNGSVLLCVDRNKADKVPPGATALLVESPLRAYQALAGFHRARFPELRVAALTGSCGKTTTKEILRTIFEHAFGAEHVLSTKGNTNNQIGVPQNLLRLTDQHRYAVIELGTNHNGEIEPIARIAAPETSLVVSIASCHLEFFINHDGVAKEKGHIFAPGSVRNAVYPFASGGHEVLVKAAASVPNRFTFGESPEADVRVIYGGGNLDGSSFELIETATGKRVKVEWNLTGRHQALNAAGAAAAALTFGIPLETIGKAVRQVSLPGFRMKKTVHNEALWINDAYNANPDSMCAALTGLTEYADPQHLLLALGDMGELGKASLKGHLRVLSFVFEHFPGARLVVIGPKMIEALKLLSINVPHPEVKTFLTAAGAVQGVRRMARPGDLVFLKGSLATGLGIIEPPAE
ncbi:MAG: UDP-N-acetylmuramoyl-tripeptide--D-alanyl-D-alanine ligase [Lentisphaeria bacterium]|nr:UDP-N-acetylmuramoyl-tripeptide--D-alanyl-D-alanine ligase [Lentisphaeria bacterium]